MIAWKNVPELIGKWAVNLKTGETAPVVMAAYVFGETNIVVANSYNNVWKDGDWELDENLR